MNACGREDSGRMGTFRSFEEIDAWQRARVLTKRVYEISRTGEFARDFALRNQIRRASVSIMSNIAEGFERGGTKEFIQFLSTAKGSAAEVRSQLFVALDQNYITKETFRELSDTSSEISRMLSGLMTYLRRTDLKGVKYKST
ncbi:MAG: four helix bundle protein [Bacteroidota bacterium]